MTEFNKEKRYVVLKLSKLTDHQKTAIGAALAEINLDESAMPECVVVEHDWPNYQETWDAIQAIVEGRYVSNDALKSEAADAFGDGYYEGFLDGAKYHEQSDCNTDPAYLGEEAIRCSEIAEDEKSKRLGIVTRQELAAQVEALKSAYQNLCGAINDMFDCDTDTGEMETATAAVFYVMQNGYNSVHAAPQFHLAERDAQKGRDGFIAGMHSQLHQRHCSQRDQIEAANQYADSIRQGGAA